MKIEFTEQENRILDVIRKHAIALDVVVRIAGGFVRDKILGLDSHDIDIAVEGMSGTQFAGHIGSITVIEARPEQSKHLETAMINILGCDVDFAGLRKETYADSRIPNIETGTPQEDASRRDLTVNAIFYNLITNEIEDYVGGLSDLNNRIARTPMDAKQTFLDDPLRVLRCIRFCAKYKLEPVPDIILATNDVEVQQSFLDKISRERICNEVIGYQEGDNWKNGFLTGNNPHFAMQLIIKFGFMDILFSPREVHLNPWDTDQNSKYHDLSILYHTLKAIEHVSIHAYNGLIPEERAIVNLALICHDLGKRDVQYRQLKNDGTYSYLGHEDRSVELSEIVLHQINCAFKMKVRVLNIVRHHMRFHALESNPSKKSIRKILRDLSEDWRLLLIHSEADSCGKMSVDIGEMINRHLNFHLLTKTVMNEQGNVTKIIRPINGNDLADIGVPKGPKMGIVFKALDEALLDNPVMSKEEALEFVRNFNNV